LVERQSHPVGGHCPAEIRFAVELHCFFLGLEETDEMLQRLRGADRVSDARPAVSRIANSNAQIRPVDRTAWAVAGFPRE